ELGSCRRKYLLEYFGEKYESENCGGCDLCLAKKETFDATIITQKILSTIIRTGSRFGANYIIDVLKGRNTKQIRERKHNTLSVYGIVNEFSDGQLKEIIKSLIGAEIIEKAQGEYPILLPANKGKRFLNNKEKIFLPKPKDDDFSDGFKIKDDFEYDEILFDKLRVLRKKIAEKLNIPPFVIFSDVSLREMAYYFPTDEKSFLKITGVGEQKLKNFGNEFLQEINEYARENNLQPKEFSGGRRQDGKKESAKIRTNSETYQITREFLEKKILIADIAKARGLAEGTIVSHIEKMIASGKNLDIEYLKPSAEIFNEIKKSFEKCDAKALTPVYENLGGKYDYEIIRLVRMFLV
ncbi:MAG TPA: DNA helicase RecQ, partial [Candidatus Moranbacteria bacterium]|nr:DNA helicase RecQ [Candidatus Moranbacteria bacterium]